MRQNNRGFSLVELIVALAIFAIAGVAVFGFMVNSSRMYQRSNVDVKLQYEQQLAVNQIRDMVVESDKGIYFDQTSKTLALYGAVKTESGSKSYPVTVIRYVETDGKIFFGTKEFSAVSEITFADVETSKLLVENVTGFNVDLTKVKNDKVLFEVIFTIGDKEQKVTETVALRNRLVVSNQVDTIWGDTPIVVDSFIQKVTISRGAKTFATGEQDTIGKLGNSVVVAYSAEVSANEESEREYDFTVSWSIDTTEGVMVGADGKVTVAATVPSGTTFKLYATSVDDPSKSTYIEIEVTDGGVYPVSVSLACPAANITDGNGFRTYKLVPTITFSDNSKSSDCDLVIWDGLDSLPDGATFSGEMGELTVGSNANGLSITVKAKAKERKADGEVAWGEYTIVVDGIKEYVPGPVVRVNCSTSLARGGYVFPTMVLENASHSNYTYNWKVEPYYDEETSRFDGDVANAKFSYVSLNTTGGYSEWNVNHEFQSNADRRSIALNCAQQLNWSETFKVKVSGTATDAEGNVLVATPKIVTVSPVEISIIRADLADYHKPDPVTGAGGYQGYPCLTDTEICYEDWNFDGRQPGNIYASQFDARRWYYIEYTNLYIAGDWLNGCTAVFNYAFKNSGGQELLNSNVGVPTGTLYNGSMRYCGFMKQKLYDWESNPDRPVEMSFSLTMKDNYGNQAESNKDSYKLVYEWREIDVSR